MRVSNKDITCICVAIKKRSGIIHRAVIVAGASFWPWQQSKQGANMDYFIPSCLCQLEKWAECPRDANPELSSPWKLIDTRMRLRVSDACSSRESSMWLNVVGVLSRAKRKQNLRKLFKNETKNFRGRVRRNEKCFPPKQQQNDKLLLPFWSQARKPLFTSIIYFWSLKMHYHINSLHYTIWATKWVYLMPS